MIPGWFPPVLEDSNYIMRPQCGHEWQKDKDIKLSFNCKEIQCVTHSFQGQNIVFKICFICLSILRCLYFHSSLLFISFLYLSELRPCPVLMMARYRFTHLRHQKDTERKVRQMRRTDRGGIEKQRVKKTEMKKWKINERMSEITNDQSSSVTGEGSRENKDLLVGLKRAQRALV